MPTAKKAAEIEAIAAGLREADVAILADYRGLSVAALGTLRGQLRPAGTELRVVKNTLTRIAAGQAGIEGLDELLVGPTAIAFAKGDIGAPARILQDAARTTRILNVKGAVLGGKVLPATEVGRLASLPSRPQLQAQLVGNLQGALTGFVGTLNGAISNLVYVLEAKAAHQGEVAA